MTKIYLDSAPIIYLVEQVAPWFAAVAARLAMPGVSFVVSDLSRMECKVVPLRTGNVGLLTDFENFFQRAATQVFPVSASVFDRAAEIRAQYRFQTPDAIHLAAAVLSGCDVFFTNDHRLARCTAIPVEVL